MKLTPWIDGDIKPVRVGVYERNYGSAGFAYCKWDGKYFFAGKRSIKEADLATSDAFFQNLPWRGLAEKPK
ncbi:hypothetical protein ACO0K2_18000 [Undibacterium sp. MH2W]|uniref:hypothetical protein n=1 Tax=Undibacterium sp. MH2W TaxID=3413044 RepID=UPI003BF315CD